MACLPGSRLAAYFLVMSRLLRRQFCTSPAIPEQSSTATPSPLPRSFGPLPLPHRSVPDPAGQDLDVVTLAHSHLVREEWPRLDALASGLTPFRVKHVLLRVRRDPVLSLEFFDWAHLQNPGLLTLENHAIILHILTKDRRFRPAESILRRMLISVFKGSSLDIFDALLHSYRLCDSSPRVFDSLFTTYAHLKKFRDATDTFRRMRGYGFLPTVKSCNAFLSSLLSLDRGDIVLTLYREMTRCRISPNAYTLNMVMRALCNSGRLEHALKLFDEMEKKGFGPMVSTFNTLIDGYCKKGLLVAAMKLKSEMGSRGLHPNVYTYNTLIHGFCKEGKLQDANKIFNEMKAANVSPNTVTYNTLISGYSRINNSEMGFRLHEEMVRDGIEVDVLTYNALILGLANEGKTKKAAYLLKELDKQDLVPTASTFSALIIGQCKRQNSERALHIHKVMKKSGFQLDADTFNLLVSTFCKNQDFEGAVELLGEMLQRSMAPPDALLVELLGGLGRSGKTHVASELFSEFSGHKLIPEKFLKDLSGTQKLEGG